jgi:hypothetical protein
MKFVSPLSSPSRLFHQPIDGVVSRVLEATPSPEILELFT